MQIEGDAPLDLMVWLTEAPEAQQARALAAAAPAADWLLGAMDRARLRFRGEAVDLELAVGRRWTELFTGRVTWTAVGTAPAFRPYSLDWPQPLLRLESCWFAVDLDARVGCFDRDQLGAAPMKRCWGPRPAPPAPAPDVPALVAALGGRHATNADLPARAFTFVADANALATALRADAPEALARRWLFQAHDHRALLSTGRGTPGSEPVPPELSAWLHRAGVCHGCTRASVRDGRLGGCFVYQSPGRARAAPYERIGEPIEPWTVEQAAAALGLNPTALRASVLPVRFAEKDRLQPLEYARCTWSETVPWETEAGEQFGTDVSRAPR
jgi:hypothetical protein